MQREDGQSSSRHYVGCLLLQDKFQRSFKMLFTSCCMPECDSGRCSSAAAHRITVTTAHSASTIPLTCRIRRLPVASVKAASTGEATVLTSLITNDKCVTEAIRDAPAIACPTDVLRHQSWRNISTAAAAASCPDDVSLETAPHAVVRRAPAATADDDAGLDGGSGISSPLFDRRPSTVDCRVLATDDDIGAVVISTV
jgi:hypothetical protein